MSGGVPAGELGDLARAQRDRVLAIKWANQSVSMLQATFFPLADALRALEEYLSHTPHHNAPEAAAARKALRAFDACEIPPTPPIEGRDADVERDEWLRGDWYEKWQDATEDASDDLMATLEALRIRVERTILAALQALGERG